MDTSELLALFDREQRRAVEFFGFRRAVTPHVVRSVPEPDCGGRGFILYSDLAGADVERAIDEQIAFFGGLKTGFEWKLYGHDAPADLGERLAARGFEPQEIESVMILDLDETPAIVQQPVRHDIRRVTDPSQIADLVALEQAVWGEPLEEIGRQLAAELRETGERLCLYLAFAGGVPASAAWIRFHPPSQFASLWGGATLPGYRGRGLYTALLAVRCQEARRRGCRFLTVDASDMSRPILERRGFRLLTTARDYSWQPPGAGAG